MIMLKAAANKHCALWQDDIWHLIQQSLAQQPGQQAKDLLAAHSMQSLLVPGVLSPSALSDALLELEQPLSSDQVPLQEALQHLTAAAQVCHLRSCLHPVIHSSVMVI